MYTSYTLSDTSRDDLLLRFPPKFKKVIAHHITYEFGVEKGSRLPPPSIINVVGYNCDCAGIEVLIASVDGTILRTHNGGVYHITWSLDPDVFKPKDGNVVACRGDQVLLLPIPILTTPTISN